MTHIPTHRPRRLTTEQLQLIQRGDPRREQLRAHLNDVYGDAFGAEPGHLHELLLGLHDERGIPRGLIGASVAAHTPQLFVEQYLDVPVEQLWAERLGRRVDRREIVEVGNLAARHTGLGPWLVASLAHHLDELGIPLTVFAGTAELRASFAHMGVTLVDHGPADPARLGDAVSIWGSYYTHDPHVCTVHVRDVIAANQSLAERCPDRARLLEQARRLACWRRSA